MLAPQYLSNSYVRDYLQVHMNRFTETVGLLERILQPGMRIVDLGSYGSLVPVFRDLLGLTDITLTQPFQEDKPSSEDTILQNARNGENYSFRLDRFDLEGRFPYDDGVFDLVVFTEVLEHLSRDPLQTMSEINRITKKKGFLVLSTPNCASARSILRILRGGNPNIYPVYQRRPSTDRHNHEYAPWEVKELFRACGYRCLRFKTTDVYEDQQFGRLWTFLVRVFLASGSALTLNLIKATNRGDTIFAVGEKVSSLRERYPSFLYAPASRPAAKSIGADREAEARPTSHFRNTSP